MDDRIQLHCRDVDWSAVSQILKTVGMAYHAPDVHQRAFEASFAAVFVYRGDRLVGFGRALSDGEYQAAVYDCAVVPDLQGQGLGRRIMETLLERVAHCNVILYASPGMEGFYQRLGLRRMKTGMARFRDPAAARKRGFTG